MAVSAIVNSKPVSIHAETSCPILYVLRNDLSLNSPRYGCGKEQCGACRVLINGELKYSCTVTVEEVDTCSVMTVEGLGDQDSLHPLQQAFLDLNAAQCGYCLSGIIMTALHLLQENPDPTDSEIRYALRDNLCRCGAHNRIVKAVQLAAQRMIRE